MTHFDLITADGEIWRDLIVQELEELHIKDAYLLRPDEFKFLDTIAKTVIARPDPDNKQTNTEGTVMQRKEIIEKLKTFQRWRRGEGEFQWSEDPAKNKPLPFNAQELGECLDAAIKALSEDVKA